MPTFSLADGLPPISVPSVVSVASSLANLSSPAAPVTPAAATVPASSSPLPAKLVKRILDREYIDMVELVPDSWRFQEEEQNKCCHQNKRLRRGPVTDILLWVECYASLVEVLSSCFPQKTSELMTYLKTIVKAHRSFAGEGWVTYDSCYRRKAAITKSLDWGQVDFTLYNETFTGRAKIIALCKFCLSEHHISSECAFAPDMPSHKLDSVTRPTLRPQYDTGKLYTPICHLFNNRAGKIYRFNPCRFGHICNICRGSHPASQCGSRPPPSKWQRSASPVGKGRYKQQ